MTQNVSNIVLLIIKYINYIVHIPHDIIPFINTSITYCMTANSKVAFELLGEQCMRQILQMSSFRKYMITESYIRDHRVFHVYQNDKNGSSEVLWSSISLLLNKILMRYFYKMTLQALK